MMKKKEGVLEGSGWGNSRARVGGGRNPGPPKALKSKKITKHKSEKQNAKGEGEQSYTPGAQARWRILGIILGPWGWPWTLPGDPKWAQVPWGSI